MNSFYSQCMAAVTAYLERYGFVSHRIATAIIAGAMNPDIMKRTSNRVPWKWAAICINRLKQRCKNKNPKVRRSHGHEPPGIYLIDMPKSPNDGDVEVTV